MAVLPPLSLLCHSSPLNHSLPPTCAMKNLSNFPLMTSNDFLLFSTAAKVGKTSLIMSLVSEEFPDEVKYLVRLLEAFFISVR